MYSVIATPIDFRYSVCIFVSPDLTTCVSVATTCFQNSKLSCFKIVDESDNALISFNRF